MLHEYEIQKRKMDLWRWKTSEKNRIIFESENEFKNWIRDGFKLDSWYTNFWCINDAAS